MAASPSAEIHAAVSYLVSHLSSLSLSPSEHASLAGALTASLQAKYASHWHPSDPERGSAYRALTRTGSSLDDVLASAIRKATSVKVKNAAKALAASMGSDKWTLWIDPGCVSIRMHGGPTLFSSPLDASPASSKLTVSGIVEIWGKLPSAVAGGARVQPVARPKTPAAATKQSLAETAAIAAEFEALAVNASPAAKKSKAVAIMRPAAVHKGIASMTAVSFEGPVSTPPRPLPPLSFTIQESTSPYVPSFASSGLAPSVQADNASTSSGNTVTRAPTPSLLGSLVSPTLPASESGSSSSASSPSCTAATDPFARPSSRSSTTSLNSSASCSIFSHASSDSRSSSIGSFSTEEVTASERDGNTTVTSLGFAKASQNEKEAAKSFTFPGSNMLKADTLALLPQQSAPNSPSKPRRRHDRSASIVSASSSHGSYTRRPSSRAEVVVDKEVASKPQEYSNGKVGVLGGGVMLGPKKDGNSTNNHKRNHSTASSNGNTLNVARTNSRPPKVRTTSSGSMTSNGSADHHQQHHYQTQTQQYSNNQFYQHYTNSQQGQGYSNNWAHYPAPPAHIPQQYRY